MRNSASRKLVCTEFNLLIEALFNLSMVCPMVMALISGTLDGLHGMVTGAFCGLHNLISSSWVCMLSFLVFTAMSSLILLASNSFGMGVGEMALRFSSLSVSKWLADVMTGKVLGALITLIVSASL